MLRRAPTLMLRALKQSRQATSRIACLPVASTAVHAVPRAAPVRPLSGGTSFLPRPEVQDRVMEVLKGFPKVDQSKLSPVVAFAELGLDSLDAVELVMALEDEFQIQIDDGEAEKILSAKDAIEYLSTHPHAK